MASVILAIVDPFEMRATVGFAGRLIYWVVVIGVALQIATAMHFAFQPLYRRVGTYFSRLILGFVFAVCFCPFLFMFNAIFYPVRYETMMAWPQLFGFLFLIFCAIGVVMEAVSYQFTGKFLGEIAEETAAVTTVAAPEIPQLPAFMERLEPKLGTDLIRLSMQDHYVEAHTDRGSQLILMRLADAIRELDGLDGLQVHRSHWVTMAHVTGIARDQGRVSLVTSDNAEVPVSRSYRAQVKAAGLLG